MRGIRYSVFINGLRLRRHPAQPQDAQPDRDRGPQHPSTRIVGDGREVVPAASVAKK
jgi:hypothetical protein